MRQSEVEAWQEDEGDSREAERRSTARYVAKLAVRFSDARQFVRAYDAYTRNIGLGGLCVATDKPYRQGDEVAMHIELPDGTTLEITGKVAWVKPGVAAGVRFDALSPLQSETLKALLKQARR
ncbi:MAG: PilZ domain-containing protein [Myxococcales bacterium]